MNTASDPYSTALLITTSISYSRYFSTATPIATCLSRSAHAVSGGAGLARGRHGFGRRLDELGHVTGVGDHRDVAGGDLDGGGAHAGGELPLSIGRDRLVVGGDQVPGRQRFPGRDAHHVAGGGGGQRLLHGVHHPCPDRVDVGGEMVHEVVFGQPVEAVGVGDQVGQRRGHRPLGQQRAERFALVQAE